MLTRLFTTFVRPTLEYSNVHGFAGVSGSIVVCISPLTTIMIDQKAKFEQMGISAELVGEAQDNQGVVAKITKEL